MYQIVFKSLRTKFAILLNKNPYKTKLLRLSKTQVIFYNIKGPELLHRDCDSVCSVCE
jgi:hypothetical protein